MSAAVPERASPAGRTPWSHAERTLLPLALTAVRFGAPRLLTGVLLMTSWAPSLGGIATPVGTAPNLIGLRLLEEATGARPSFAQWTLLFAPLAVVATALTLIAVVVVPLRPVDDPCRVARLTDYGHPVAAAAFYAAAIALSRAPSAAASR